MWTSPCFNHTLPLGVTVALHQACLVAKNGRQQVPLEEPLPGQQAGPEGSGRRGQACRGVFTYLCPLWRDKLFEHYPLWTFSQAEDGRID